jgi:aminopeptidase-like protein
MHNEEILLSTYICHPSLANNELSGPCLAIFLANWIKTLPQRRFTYRVIFIPETIGSITYLSKNLDILKRNVIAGFNLTCVGDDRTYSCLESRYANTLADKVIQNVLKFHYPEYKRYPF